MSRNRILWLLSLWLLLTAGGTAHAQIFQPLVDPASLDMDFKWFKPVYDADLTTLDWPDPHTGPYFAYSRATLAMSRPDETPGSEDIGDWAWGNRYDFGYMLDENKGWSFTYWAIGSPNRSFSQDFINRNDEILLDLLGDPVGPTRTTINDARYNSFEANRTWRVMDRFGWVMFEPYVGGRYIRVGDKFTHQTYDPVRTPAPATGPANGSLSLLQEDIFTNNRFETGNDLFGGQFGLRMTTWRGRWRLVTNIRGMLYNNFKNGEDDLLIETNTRTDTANYDANSNLTGVTTGAVISSEDRTLSGRYANDFVWGGELQLQTFYDLSTHVALTGSLEALVLANGIGRGTRFGSEAFTLGGATFGLSFNH